MTVAIVSQEITEVLILPVPQAAISQEVVEVLTLPSTTKMNISQLVVEMLSSNSSYRAYIMVFA